MKITRNLTEESDSNPFGVEKHPVKISKYLDRKNERLSSNKIELDIPAYQHNRITHQTQDNQKVDAHITNKLMSFPIGLDDDIYGPVVVREQYRQHSDPIHQADNSTSRLIKRSIAGMVSALHSNSDYIRDDTAAVTLDPNACRV